MREDNSNKNLERLADLGEWNTIEALLPLLDQNVLAKNDDAVAIEVTNKYVVCNTDILVWETDVPQRMTPYQAGKKLVTMTVSDVVAKGGKPKCFLSAALYPPEARSEEFLAVSKGIKEQCSAYQVGFLGGDLGEGSRSLTGVCLGLSNKVVPRSGASPGDFVWSTGYFGKTGAAFDYLFSNGTSIEEMSELLQSVLEPEIQPYLHEIIGDLATASIDSSDGLSISLHELAKESNVQIKVEKLPISSLAERYARQNNLAIRDLVLYGGEEFHIIFTTDRSPHEIKALFQKENLPSPLLIGRVKKGTDVFLKDEKIPRKGWEHFKRAQ